MKKRSLSLVLFLVCVIFVGYVFWANSSQRSLQKGKKQTDDSNEKIVGSKSSPDRLESDLLNKTSSQNSHDSDKIALNSGQTEATRSGRPHSQKILPKSSQGVTQYDLGGRPSSSQNSDNYQKIAELPSPSTPERQNQSGETNDSQGSSSGDSSLAPSPTPPQPPKPTPTPPKPNNPPQSSPVTDEEKARRVFDSLSSPRNNNVAQFTDDQGRIRTVLWVNGITAPKLGLGGDFIREETNLSAGRYVDYVAPYKAGVNWYDVDKSFANDQDANLCFAAVAANMLHWWYDRNAENIDKLIAKRQPLPDGHQNTYKDLAFYKNSFNSQQQSRFFDMYKLHFGYNQGGFFTDLLVDLFLNGHTPKPSGGTNDNWEYIDNFKIDPRGGLFYEVFGKKPLTERTFGGSYSGLNRQLRNILREGKIAGLAYTVLGRPVGHIVTLWGAEYDLDGNLVGVYITDSDDKDYKLNGMKRYNIYNNGGKSVLSNNLTNKNYGSSIDYIHVLSSGDDRWTNL